jgi:hypothetical protein
MAAAVEKVGRDEIDGTPVEDSSRRMYSLQYMDHTHDDSRTPRPGHTLAGGIDTAVVLDFDSL